MVDPTVPEPKPKQSSMQDASPSRRTRLFRNPRRLTGWWYWRGRAQSGAWGAFVRGEVERKGRKEERKKAGRAALRTQVPM